MLARRNLQHVPHRRLSPDSVQLRHYESTHAIQARLLGRFPVQLPEKRSPRLRDLLTPCHEPDSPPAYPSANSSAAPLPDDFPAATFVPPRSTIRGTAYLPAPGASAPARRHILKVCAGGKGPSPGQPTPPPP